MMNQPRTGRQMAMTRAQSETEMHRSDCVRDGGPVRVTAGSLPWVASAHGGRR
jgi:hypothetical protein